MVAEAAKALRNAAGNYYVNDKSTGSVVAQQPFGGARASGRGPPLLRLVHRQREDHWEVKAVELNVECGSVTSTPWGTVINGEKSTGFGAWIRVH